MLYLDNELLDRYIGVMDKSYYVLVQFGFFQFPLIRTKTEPVPISFQNHKPNRINSSEKPNQYFWQFLFFCGSIFSVFILPLPPTLVLILRCRLKLWPQNSFISSRRTQILNFSFVTLFSSTCSENFNRYFKYTPFTWRGLSVLA